MTGSFDPRMAAIDRRLERRSGVEPPPGLRQRVLTAVDDVLAAPRPTPRVAADDGRIHGWAWATAVMLVIAVIMPGVARVTALRRREPPTLVARLRAAGVDDEPLVATLAASAPRGAPIVSDRRAHAMQPPSAALRPIDVRRLFEEHP